MLRIVALSGSLLVLVSLAGCGDDAMPPPPPAADGGGRLDARVDARAGDGDIPPMPDGGMDAPPGEDAGSDGGDPCLGVDCSEMDDPCHLGVCNPATRDCEQQVRADGSSCDDGVPCTAGDVCASGACAGVAVDCSAMTDACNTGTCDAASGTCVLAARPDGSSCDDSDACTTSDACAAGTCAGAPVDCTPMADACNTAACAAATGTCVRTPVGDGTPCDDRDACTSGDVCAAGACRGAPSCPVSCSGAPAVADGTTLSGVSLASGTETLTFAGCGPTLYHALYYTATIPAGETLTVSAVPRARTVALTMRLLDSCTATTCLASATAGFARDITALFYENTTASARTVVLALGNDSATATELLDLTVRIGPPPTNRSCAMATPVADGTFLLDQRAAFGIDNVPSGPGCRAIYGALYYQATIDPGERLVATAYPQNRFLPALSVLPSCGATGCLATSGTGLDGDVSGVGYTNSTASPVTVVVAAGATNATARGWFNLGVRILPAGPAYAESTIPTACEDMSAATMLTVGDDSISANFPLPFPFLLGRETVSYYAICDNGYMELLASPYGSRFVGFANGTIPSSILPNGIVAPFWDDIVPVGATNDIRVGTFTSGAGRHLVVQWTDQTLYDDMTARMTYQAHLYEGSNVIELHYCTLSTMGARALVTGGSATVGVESPSAQVGYLHSFNTADSVSDSAAIRLTPVP